MLKKFPSDIINVIKSALFFLSRAPIHHSFTFNSRPVIFKLPQEVLKFDDICMSWSSTKTGLEMKFLKSKNRSFEKLVLLNSNF